MNEYTSWEKLPLMLGVKETSKLLGYGTAKVRELCRVKAIPCIHEGRAFRIPKDALQLWIAKTCGDNASATLRGNHFT